MDQSYSDVVRDGGPDPQRHPSAWPDTQTITCNCKWCEGKSARVRGTQHYTPTMVHNLVGIAHSPLARAASAQRSGPWPQ